jgi:hypothetical protein
VSPTPDDEEKAERKARIEGKRREFLAQKLAEAVNAGATPLDDGSYIPKDVPWLYASKPLGASVQERLFCLRQNARRSRPGLAWIEARIRSGEKSLADFPHFMPWLRDFLPLAREARVLGLPAAWEWGPPQDIAEVRQVVEQLAEEAERDLVLVKEGPAAAEPSGAGGAPPLSEHALRVLKFLAKCDTLQTVLGITEGLENPLSYNPVRSALAELEAAGLVNYPKGRKKGVGVTEHGRQRAALK